MSDPTPYTTPVMLEGRSVRLEPLALGHVHDLAEVGCDDEIWKLMLYGTMCTEADMRVWVKDLLRQKEAGTDLPFAVIHKAEGRAIGATRYLEIRPQHRSLEIGGTWYAREFQRTSVNTECKYLLLRHAFEDLGCIRVQFKTDTRNLRSWRAIERIGAVKEGIFRNHFVLRDGTVRDSVYFSIVDREWPKVKTNLERKLAG